MLGRYGVCLSPPLFLDQGGWEYGLTGGHLGKRGAPRTPVAMDGLSWVHGLSQGPIPLEA